MNRLLSAGALAVMMGSPMAMAADTVSPVQKKQMEQVVHDYLLANPEVLVEVSQALQQKQQKNMQQEAQSGILKNAGALFTEKLAVAGNPKGSVTMVEFFDYQCIHCKKMVDIINSLIKKDPELRVIYKEFPIFGGASDQASRAALAAAMQGKYEVLHNALLNADKKLDEGVILEIAKSAGLDMDKLKKDMQSSTVTASLEANRKLADGLHLMGTPAFIIAATPGGQLKPNTEPAFIPGGASEEVLQGLITKAK